MSRARRHLIGEPWVDLAAAILRQAPRLRGAPCIGRPELFDGDDEATRVEAIGLCASCPVLPVCQSWVKTTAWKLRPRGVVAAVFYPHVHGQVDQ